MANGRVCGKCGASLTGVGHARLCPGCLLEGGLASAAEAQVALDRSQSATPKSEIENLFPRPFGDYELLEEVARGGMGIVYKARQASLDRMVAVKMLLFGPLAKPEFVQRFRAEAAAAASLRHPNIVAIHEVGYRDGHHFFAMDYVEGQNLAMLVANQPLPARRAATCVRTIAEAIQFAHKRGILHRDLKPSNVLIDAATDQPRVTDFGLAKRLDKDSELTLSGQVLGSPNYMPPEQAAAHRGMVGKRSDVYSLGAILYHLLTGRPPFVAATVGETLQQLQTADPVSPTVLNPRLPRDLKTICLKCLEKEPARRYQTAQELADELGRFLKNEPILARPVSRPEKVWRWCRRNPVVATLIITVAFVFLAGFAGVFWQWKKSEKNRALAHATAYASDMNLVHQAVRMHNLGRAWELLNRYRPEVGREELRGWEWRYLWGRGQSDAMFQLCRLPEFEGVISAAMRPGANWVAIGGEQRSGVEVWDLSTRGRVVQLAAGEPFAQVAFSPDGSRLAFSTWSDATKTGWLRVWDCTKEIQIAETSLDSGIVSLSFSMDDQTIVAFQPNKAVTRWRASNLEKLNSRPVPKGHASRGSPFAVTPDLRTAVVVNGWDGIVVLDLETGKERWRTNSPSGWSNAMAISPDEARLATSFGISGAIQIWDLATGAQLAQLEGHRAWVSALKFRPDGKTLVSASADQTIRMWDLERRQSIRTLQGHRHEIWGLGLSSDDATLVSGGKDGEVLVWDAREDPTRRSSWTLRGSHWSWRFSTDGRAIHAVERTTNHFSQSLRSSGREPTFGQAIDAFERDPGRLLRYQGPTLERVEVLQEVQFNGDFAFSPSGRLFAASMTNGVLRIWDLNERTLAHEILTGARDSRPAAFSTDETRIWLLQRDGDEAGRSMLTEWDLRTQQRLRSIRGVRDRYLTLHPDDWLFWKSDDGTLVFHDLRTGQASHPEIATRRLAALTGFPSASFDGSLLVLGHELGLLTVWETAPLARGAGPRNVKTLGGIVMAFSDSGFTPDDTRLLGGSHRTEAIKIWETRAYHELLTLEADGTHFHNIGISADGRLLGALNSKGTLHLWYAPSWEEIEAREKTAKAVSAE